MLLQLFPRNAANKHIVTNRHKPQQNYKQRCPKTTPRQLVPQRGKKLQHEGSTTIAYTWMTVKFT